MPQPSAGPRALLSQAALQILMVLAQRDAHGYAIKQAIEERTSGELSLGPGTLYEAIHRMLRDGLIEEAGVPPGAEGGGRRRFYRITESGRREMQAELARLDRLVRQARSARLLPEEGGA